MKNYLYAAVIGFGLVACSSSESGVPQSQAQQLIDQAIATHGGSALQQVHISFDFRKKHYDVFLDQGKFVYESTVDDSLGLVHDVLTNQQFTRSVDQQTLDLNKKDKNTYSNSLNSVVYFVLLPYPLNDPAANKEYIGEATVEGEPYHKVRVTFTQEGGGEDFDDVYVYWIHRTQHTLDYLAYSFHVNGGGTRFRKAYNVREIEGIRFADYINYESTEEDFSLKDYDQLFEAGKVKELSRIETEHVEVQTENVEISSESNQP